MDGTWGWVESVGVKGSVEGCVFFRNKWRCYFATQVVGEEGMGFIGFSGGGVVSCTD